MESVVADQPDGRLAATKDHDEFDDAAPNSESGNAFKNKMVSKLLGAIVDRTFLKRGGAIDQRLRSVPNDAIAADTVLAKDVRRVNGRNSKEFGARILSKKLQSARAMRSNDRLAALSKLLSPATDRGDSSGNVYKCPVCDVGFETTSTRNKHMSRVHVAPKRFDRVQTAAPRADQLQSSRSQSAVAEEACSAFYPEAMRKFNGSSSDEEVRSLAKQALRDLQYKSRLKRYA